MFRLARTGIFTLTAALALAACGKKADNDAPIAFVPADTPYVIAALEPIPDATAKHLMAQMQAMWATSFPILENALADLQKAADGEDQSPEAKATAAKGLRVAKAVLDEIRDRDTAEKWKEIGFGTQVRSAIYGVGALPVMRMEIVDPDALRAFVARVEEKSGSKLDTARIGDQDVWTLGGAQALGLAAIEGKHLVITVVPAKGDDALKRRVLGLDRPAKSLADTGALEAFNKQRGYLPYASGWIDTRKLFSAAIDDPAVAQFAADGAKSIEKPDATCRAEIDAVLAKAPLLALGYTKFDTSQATMHMRLDLDPTLAKSLAAVPDALPGKRSDNSLIDIAFSLPVLRGRDFLVAQAEAVSNSPFRCAKLAELNESMAQAKDKLGETIPPPLSDLIGLRLTVDKVVLPSEDGSRKLDVAARILVGSNNPAFLASLAQMTVPQLQKTPLTPDGKAVSIPSDVVPGGYLDGYELHAAMGAKTLGIAVGKDGAAALEAAVSASGETGKAVDTHVSGAFYTLIGDAIGQYGSLLPEDQRSGMELNAKLYSMYAQWFKSINGSMAFGNEGIDFVQDVEYAKQ